MAESGAEDEDGIEDASGAKDGTGGSVLASGEEGDMVGGGLTGENCLLS